MTFPISTRLIQNIGVIHAVKLFSLLLLVSPFFPYGAIFVFISFEVEIFINKRSRREKKNADPQTTSCPNDIFEMRMSVKRVRMTNFG